ncbi:MAG TPA: methyltransferase domain-containing protein [Pseudonocardiaceae bacterium]|nr:methyltransferase domain-containing protein [Pseudonocardiaceae bacterium]
MTPRDRRTATAQLWGLAGYSGRAADRSGGGGTVDAAAPDAAERVLDVAAGTGNVAMRAAARGAQVTACDIAPSMAQLGRAGPVQQCSGSRPTSRNGRCPTRPWTSHSPHSA